jgi:hypothetical protein
MVSGSYSKPDNIYDLMTKLITNPDPSLNISCVMPSYGSLINGYFSQEIEYSNELKDLIKAFIEKNMKPGVTSFSISLSSLDPLDPNKDIIDMYYKNEAGERIFLYKNVDTIWYLSNENM